MSEQIRLLIVDDSQMSTQIIRSRFSKIRPKWELFESDNGNDAIEMIYAIHPHFITMDVNMPNMSGMEAAQRIIKLFPKIKIVLITANIQDAVRDRAQMFGFQFIEKPIEEGAIEKSVQFFEASLKND